MNTSYKHNITLLFLLFATLPAFGQFRMIGTASWTVVSDSTYSGTINFQVDLTGKGYLATSVVDTFRLFTGTEQIYTITSVGTKTFSSAQVTIKEYNGDHGIPIGQVMVYDPAGKTTLPQAPFGSTGSTAQLQAAVDTYNSRLLSSAGVDLTPYSTTLQMRQEISDSIATVTGLADGDKGDITVSGSGATWTIDANAVDADNIATNAVGADEIAPSGVAAASYTAPNITVDQDGRITSATSNTTLVNRAELGDSTAAIRGDMLTGNETITLSGDVTGSGTTAITTTISAGTVGPDELASTAVTPGSYTNANITVDADGRVTAASSGTDNTGMVTFDVIGDAGTAETISNADELYLRGQFGVNTSNSTTDIINFNVDSSEVATLYALGDTSTILRALINSVGSGSVYVLYAEDFYISDWAAAINTAIDSLNGLGGGTLILPPDTLLLNRQTSTGATDYCIQLKDNVNVIGNGTTLKVADGQVTDAYPTVHLMYGYALDNVTISGIDFVGNTAGQTGYTGGYKQGPSGATGIYLFGAAAVRGDNFNLINTRFFDFFGAATTLQYTNNMNIENYYAEASGELLEASINTNVRASNIHVRNALGGDGIEFAHAQNLILTNFQADSVLLGAGLDIYGCNKGVIDGGHLSYTAGVNLHHTDVFPVPGNFMDSIYEVTVSNVTSVNSLGYGLEVNAENLKRTTIQNFVAKNGTLGGGLFGRRDSTELNYEIEVYDSQFDDNGGPGVLVYNVWRIEFNNCSFNRNQASGINARTGINSASQSEVGAIYVHDSEMIGNGDFAFETMTTTDTLRADITAYMDDNNADGGNAIGRNISIGAVVGDQVKIRNTRPIKITQNGQNYQYIGGDTKMYYQSAQIRTLYGNGVHNQSIEVKFAVQATIIHGSAANEIQTIAGANLTAAAGDVVRFYYDASTNLWYQEPGPWGKNLGLYAYTNLKVGINNTVPGYPLDVSTTSGPVMRLADSGSSTQTLYYGNAIYSTNTTFSIGSNVAGQALYFNSPTSNQIITLSGTSAGIGGITSPTARLHLPASTTSASSAPLKFNTGTLMTTPESGAVEWDGTNLYVTQTTGPTRKTIAYTTDIANAQQYAQSHIAGGENTGIDAGTPEQVNATTTGTVTTIVNTSEFTVQADGDLQYTGANNSVLELTVDISVSNGGASSMYYYIAINGTVQATSRVRNDAPDAAAYTFSINWIDSDADTNDVYSVYAEPVTGTELTTVTDMRIKARKIK